MSNETANKQVYECLNSLGFDDPFLFIEIDNPSIKLIMKIEVEVTALIYNDDQSNSSTDTSHGSGCLGECLVTEDEWQEIETNVENKLTFSE